ncbi:MAG: cytochrome b/b6 domain-containing protein [Dokdonella sp.]
MALKSDAMHWGSLAKLFHWIVVLLILVQGTIGLIMVDLPKKPNVIPVYTLHKSIGLTIFALALLRLLWRAFDHRPQEPASMPHSQVVGARIGHALLYTLLFAVPLSGWLFDSSSSLRPLYWWGLVQIPSLTGGKDDAIKAWAEPMHEWLFWLLILVAAGHAAAALVHHFHNRDEVLRRMLPGRRTVSARNP